MLGGKRIDPASIYAEPKIGCVNHDCDKCKAVQEPVAEYRGVTNDGHHIIKAMQPIKAGTLFYTTPPAAQPNSGCGRCKDMSKPCDITGSSCAADHLNALAAPVQEGRDWSLLEATQESLREHMAEIKRLKEALPVPVQHDECVVCGDKVRVIPRPWVGLTETEVEAYDSWADFQVGCGRQTLFDMVRDIEAKLKEKNHG
jgi:hypothetical protein